MENDAEIGKKFTKQVRINVKNDLHQRFKEKCINEGRILGTTVELLIEQWVTGKVNL